MPFSDFLIGANTVRRWEGRPPEPHSSSIVFLGLPDDTIQIELDVFCRGENESAYVDEVSERASGYTIEPVDAWDLDLWDDTEIDAIVRGCAHSLAKSDGLKSGRFYKLNVNIVSDGIHTPSRRSGFLTFEDMTFAEPDDEAAMPE